MMDEKTTAMHLRIWRHEVEANQSASVIYEHRYVCCAFLLFRIVPILQKVEYQTLFDQFFRDEIRKDGRQYRDKYISPRCIVCLRLVAVVQSFSTFPQARSLSIDTTSTWTIIYRYNHNIHFRSAFEIILKDKPPPRLRIRTPSSHVHNQLAHHGRPPRYPHHALFQVQTH